MYIGLNWLALGCQSYSRRRLLGRPEYSRDFIGVACIIGRNFLTWELRYSEAFGSSSSPSGSAIAIPTFRLHANADIVSSRVLDLPEAIQTQDFETAIVAARNGHFHDARFDVSGCASQKFFGEHRLRTTYA